MTNKFTPTQSAMLDVLSDGRPHSRDELHACLPDDLGSNSTVKVHLSHIRQKLRPKGQDIISRYVDSEFKYVWVRLVSIAGE